MEEFLKENEKEFLDYIEFKKKQEEEVKRLNDEISKKKYSIMTRKISGGKEPYKEIEERKNRIDEIKEKIANIGVGREVNRLKDLSQSDKDISDFNIKIEIEKLKKEQQKLEGEITEIINECKNSIETKAEQEEINNMQKSKNAIEHRILERRDLVEELINREIEKKEKVLSKILKRKKETVNEAEMNIKEKEKTLINVIKIEFEDEDSEYLYQLKQETIERLESELQKMKNKLQEDKGSFTDIYNINEKELDELKKLREDLNSNDLSKLEKDLGVQQEEKVEKSEINNINITEEEKESDAPNAWVPDGLGGWKPGIKDENKKISIKSIVKDKIFSLVNKFKEMLSKQDEKNSDEVETDNSTPSLAERINCEIKNPQVQSNMQYKQLETEISDDEEKSK